MKKLIYFDNAATSHFKPKIVIKTLNKTLKLSANAGRSGHNLSIKNEMLIFNARQIVANHFNLEEPNNVIFTKNCTEALNIAILGTKKKGGNVICSCFEHNSVLRPLTALESNNDITLTIIKPKNKKYITANDVLQHIVSSTYLVIITAISNVTGNMNDVEQIGKLCKEKHILFLVDAAQSCGHVKLNMETSNINFLAFAGHKGFLAPQGIGGLCINTNLIPHPIMFGGTGTESINTSQPQNLPEKLESGTLQTPLIAALASGITYIEKHFNSINFKVYTLTQYLIRELKKIKEITIYTLSSSHYGVVSFNVNNANSTDVADFLNSKYNIAVRSGLHCVPLTHKFLGTLQTGTIRVSLNFKNTKTEINTLIKALNEFIKNKKTI